MKSILLILFFCSISFLSYSQNGTIQVNSTLNDTTVYQLNIVRDTVLVVIFSAKHLDGIGEFKTKVEYTDLNGDIQKIEGIEGSINKESKMPINSIYIKGGTSVIFKVQSWSASNLRYVFKIITR